MIDIYAPTAADGLSLQELELYHLIMDYRSSLGLDAIPLSTSLTTVAGRHALDTRENIWRAGLELPEGTNLHSWSDAPYYGDHSNASIMWNAPTRLGTVYSSAGYEISAAGYSDIANTLAGWQSSAGHDAVIANEGIWSGKDWNAIGIGVENDTDFSLEYAGRVYHVWFGDSEDSAGAPELVGTSGNDSIAGTEFDDVIRANGGSDVIAGNAGSDVLYLPEPFAAYDISQNGTGWMFDFGAHSSTVTGVETYIFADQTRNASALMVDEASPLFGRYDLNGDGYDDVLAFNASSGSIGSLLMPDASWRGLGTAGNGWQVSGVGRFDGNDTSDDILWFNQSTGSIGRFDLDGSAAPAWAGIGQAGSAWDVLGAGDFNGDGIDDVLWFNQSTGGVGQFQLSAAGTATWSGLSTVGAGWEFAGTGDFNGDGSDDILWHNASSGALGMFQTSGSGQSWSGITRMGENYSVVGVGDFHGDAALGQADDILVFDASTRKLGHLDLSAQGGALSVNWHGMGQAGAAWSLLGLGDFNGDGRDDILWQQDDGRLGRFEMDGTDWDWATSGFASSAWDLLI